jgi:glycosyltransferase involved in cell wall biosynthesis
MAVAQTQAMQNWPTRILIVTDAWEPQVNGVVRTLQMVARELRSLGCTVEMITPADYPTLPLPSYSDIRLAVTTRFGIGRRIAQIAPEHVHIATEGPLGIAARAACLRAGRRFTTSYHTRFPEYLSARLPVPEKWSYRWFRRFHGAAAATLVATPTLHAELAQKGFSNLKLWNRGVDTELFHPKHRKALPYPGPIFLYVGRVAVEKNLRAFLDLDLPGTKVVVGDGPDLDWLREAYPDAVFTGAKSGQELAEIYASADVFVFPSRTDTFGLVLLEALASGVPVAAYPVMGPADVFADGSGGVLSGDLRAAALQAMDLSREEARAKAMRFSWRACAETFLDLVSEPEHAREAA